MTTLLADTGLLQRRPTSSPATQAGIEPLLAMKRECTIMCRCWSASPRIPGARNDDPVVKMAHRLGTQAGRALYRLRKQTVEPVFGIIKR